MTTIEQIALSNEKVAHWQHKQGHAQAMLAKWQSRLSALQAKGKPQPTATKLPPLTFVPGSVKFMPRQAVVTKDDRAQAEFAAKRAALRNIEAANKAGSDDDKVTSTKSKTKSATAKTPKKH